MMNNINLTLSDNTSVVDLMADVDFHIEGAEGTEADFADVLKEVVLARCEGNAKLPQGSYNIRMLCIVTKNEDKHVDEASQLSGESSNQDVSRTSQGD